MKNKTKFSHSKKSVFVVFTVLCFLVCSLVFADGDSRKPNQAEKEFYKQVINTFAKAVPPGPQGWEKTEGSTEIKELTVVYSTEKQPIEIVYRIYWQNSKVIQEANVKFQEELIKLAQKPGFKGDGVDELQQKMTPHDVEVKIDISANLSAPGLYDKAKPAPGIAGGLTFQSQGEYNGNWREGSTHVFLGKTWKQNGGYVNFTPVKSATSSTVVQNIYVKVQADSKRAEQIIQKIDWETLKKLIMN